MQASCRLAAGLCALASALLAWYPAQAQQASFSVGAEYTTGTYGGTQDIEDLYIPFTLNYRRSPWNLMLTVPFLSVRAPTGTVIGPGGEPLPGSGQIQTESGLGDITVALTYMDLWQSADRNTVLDLTGKVKLGTADEDTGLGTGETDYSVQLDLYRFLERFTLFGNAGYKFRGEPSGSTLDNVWFVAVGGSYKLNPRNRLGAAFDFRPSAFPGNDDIRELSLYWSTRAADGLRLNTYVLAGFSDSSPDWGVGFRVRFGG